MRFWVCNHFPNLPPSFGLICIIIYNNKLHFCTVVFQATGVTVDPFIPSTPTLHQPQTELLHSLHHKCLLILVIILLPLFHRNLLTAPENEIKFGSLDCEKPGLCFIKRTPPPTCFRDMVHSLNMQNVNLEDDYTGVHLCSSVKTRLFMWSNTFVILLWWFLPPQPHELGGGGIWSQKWRGLFSFLRFVNQIPPTHIYHWFCTLQNKTEK